MNYYEQVAEMLGLELGQEFSLTKPNGKKVDRVSYKITEDGIYFQASKNGAWMAEPADTLDFVLIGEFNVLPKPWKPKYKKAFWYYSVAWKKAFSDIWFDGLQD